MKHKLWTFSLSSVFLWCKGVRKPIMEGPYNFLGWTLRCLLKTDSFISLFTYVKILNVLNFVIELKRFNISPGSFLIKSIYKMGKYDFKSFSNTRFETKLIAYRVTLFHYNRQSWNFRVVYSMIISHVRIALSQQFFTWMTFQFSKNNFRYFDENYLDER